MMWPAKRVRSMKQTIAALIGLVLGASAFAQGTINFANAVNAQIRAPIYGPNPSNPTESLSGNTTDGIPPGTTVYPGSLLEGSGYTAGLFVIGGSSDPVATADFGTGANAGFWWPTVAAVPGARAGTSVQVQVRVWDNRGVTITQWAEVLADDTVARGSSSILTVGPLGGIDPGGNQFLPALLNGLESFNLHTVPEPTIGMLAGLGLLLGGCALRRRQSGS